MIYDGDREETETTLTALEETERVLCGLADECWERGMSSSAIENLHNYYDAKGIVERDGFQKEAGLVILATMFELQLRLNLAEDAVNSYEEERVNHLEDTARLLEMVSDHVLRVTGYKIPDLTKLMG